MQNIDQVQIVILAAGKGKRMQSELPKALTPLKNRAFIQHILETVKSLNLLLKPIIVVGHKKEEIIQTLGKDYVYAIQEEQLGTGHALMSARECIPENCKAILVISTDQPLVSKETLEKIISTHLNRAPAITLATASVSDFSNWRQGLLNFGRIVRGSDGAINKIVEFKDATSKEKEIVELNPALYAFEARWLWQNIDKIKNENNQKEYYLTDMIKIACDQGQKIETVQIANILEALQPNSKEELEILEKLMS